MQFGQNMSWPYFVLKFFACLNQILVAIYEQNYKIRNKFNNKIRDFSHMVDLLPFSF